MPTGLPPAAHASEPALPEPESWPDIGDRWPRTSGTGRAWDGAFLWSDFLYDDYGATGLPVQRNPSLTEEPAGSYGYTDGAAHNNGADIFRVGVAFRDGATSWRVDWNTLADRCLPAAIFALGTDESEARSWPANAGVTSRADRFLFVSCRGGWLIDDGVVTEVTELGGSHQVDDHARSFVVTLPDSALSLAGVGTLQVGSGISDASGRQLRSLGPLEGALPGGSNLYDLGLVPAEIERRPGNYWMDEAQAEALTAGDVSHLVAEVDWGGLRRRMSTDEPLPTGFSNRWYVSSQEFGHGYIADGLNTVRARFLGRVQPYGIYVPSDHHPSRPVPVTVHPHGGTASHNFWTAGRLGGDRQPMLEQVCEGRGAICVFPLGRSPWGWWIDEAEVDLMEVLNRVLATYPVDTDRITVLGLSMGGWGAYKLALSYPDVFAGAVVLAAPSACGGSVTAVGSAPLPPYGELIYRDDHHRRCVDALGVRGSGDTAPLVGNARWTPFYISHGPDDPAVPVTVALDQVRRFREEGNRYLFDLRPGRVHSLYATDPDLGEIVRFLEDAVREPAPGAIDLSWYPNNVDPELGIGTHGAWWVEEVVGAPGEPSMLSTVVARASGLVQAPTSMRKERWIGAGELGPIHYEQQVWAVPATVRVEGVPTIDLDLTRVDALAIDVAASRLDAADRAHVLVSTDQQVTFRLRGIAATTRVDVDGVTIRPEDGAVVVVLETGQHRLSLARIGSSSEAHPPAADRPGAPTALPVSADRQAGTPLPVTGQRGAVLGLACMLLAQLSRARSPGRSPRA